MHDQDLLAEDDWACEFRIHTLDYLPSNPSMTEWIFDNIATELDYLVFDLDCLWCYNQLIVLSKVTAGRHYIIDVVGTHLQGPPGPRCLCGAPGDCEAKSEFRSIQSSLNKLSQQLVTNSQQLVTNTPYTTMTVSQGSGRNVTVNFNFSGP